eukprot:5464060-Pleurochrysis_carterae.AAC.1
MALAFLKQCIAPPPARSSPPAPFCLQACAPLSLVIYAQGDYFGELAMFTQSKRTAGARASSDCILYFLVFPDFERVIAFYPQVRAALSCIYMSRRILL